MWYIETWQSWFAATGEEKGKSYDMARTVINAVQEVGRSGKPCVFKGEWIREAWRFKYDKLHWETIEGCWEKFTTSAKELHGVWCQYDYRDDEYYFWKPEPILSI